MTFRELLTESLLNKIKNFSSENIKVGSELYKDDNNKEEYIIIQLYDKSKDIIVYKDNITKKIIKTNFKNFWKNQWTYKD